MYGRVESFMWLMRLAIRILLGLATLDSVEAEED